MNLSPKVLELGRVILPGLQASGEIAVCRKCGNQVVFDPKLIPEGFDGYCPWHDSGLIGSDFALHSFRVWEKSIKIYANTLPFSARYGTLVSRLKKG